MRQAQRYWRPQCVTLAFIRMRETRFGAATVPSVLVGAEGAVLAEDHNRVASGDRTRHPEFEPVRWSAAHPTPEQAGGSHRLHLGRALPDVRRRAHLGGPRADRVRTSTPPAPPSRPGRTAPQPVTARPGPAREAAPAPSASA
ncbi:hypothetical protein GCM10023084_62130 [Streptomyces lacrimifluminis]|uniref:Uncharacterized protein n=1 Tax=Streptomyces lacrimifluminis TaxID=1500077 RepID=A0A917L4X5_9ACTN|nr:hypothetical protein GCM10012282_46970 [Streptomyces lacrimifluminis]